MIGWYVEDLKKRPLGEGEVHDWLTAVYMKLIDAAPLTPCGRSGRITVVNAAKNMIG